MSDTSDSVPRPDGNRRSFWRPIIAWPLFVLAVAALSPWPRPAEVLPECPHDPVWADGDTEAQIEQFTGHRDDVPEFQDCQKFLVGSAANHRFDSLFAVFASGRLDSIFLLPEVVPPTPIDTGTVEPGGGGPMAEAPAAGAEVQPVALISAWGDYQNLGIHRGFNCLLIARNGATWSAMMVPTGDSPECSTDLASAELTQLHVVRDDKHPNGQPYAAGEIPPVARWGFDPVRWAYYVVIKCGNGTCFVGRTGFTPEDHVQKLQSLGMSVGSQPVYEVAGWNDVQLLATRPTSGVLIWTANRFLRWVGRSISRPIEPAEPLLWGAAIPDAELGNRKVEDFQTAWVPVAEVVLATGSDDYASKANFGAVTGGEPNRVLACIDMGGNCEGLETLDCAGDASGQKWRSLHINAATGDSAYYCVTYRAVEEDGPEADIPGTVRWRWLADDETLWFRCPGGCCTPE